MTPTTKTDTTKQQHRPEWIGKAAKAVAALYVIRRVGEHTKEQMKEHLQESEAKLKANAQEAEEKIAEIIHRHFQEHKA
jgi:hypothetical protein